MLAAACGENDTTGVDTTPNPLDQLRFPAAVVFGDVPVKLRVTEALEFINEGTSALRIVSTEAGTLFTTDSYAFEVDESLPFVIPPGPPTNFNISFSAQTEVDRALTSLTFTFDDGSSATVELIAEATEALELDRTQLDFGPVLVGRPREDTLTIRNVLRRPVPIHVGTVGGRAQADVVEGVGRFEIDAAVNDEGRLASASPLAGGSTIEIPIRYVPDPSSDAVDRAIWKVGACPSLDDDCSFEVEFRGEPIPAPILCSRVNGDTVEALSFGNLNPPETASLSVRCEAQGDIEVSSIAQPSFDRTGVTVTTDLDGAPPYNLQAGVTFNLEFAFDPSPLASGNDIPEDAAFELRLRDPRTAAELDPVRIELDGGHGRPALVFDVPVVDFQSARFDTERKGRVVVTNVGPVAFSGTMVIEPGPDTPAAAFSSPLQGAFVDIDPGQARMVDLGFEPSAPEGPRTAVARFETTELSDPRNPELVFSVPLSGRSEDLPPCQLRLSSSRIPFGRSVPKTENRAYFTVQNASGAECMINGIGLAPGSDPEIFLVESKDEIRLGIGETHVFELGFLPDRAFSATDLDFEATFEFYASDDDRSTFEIPVTAAQSPIVVMRAPNVVDLRGGDPQCSSYRSEVALLNRQTSILTVEDIRIEGFDAGAFELELPGPLPFNLAPLRGREVVGIRSVTSQARERDRSAWLTVELTNTSTAFVVPLLSRVESDFPVREGFVQASAPETDVVFVLPFHFGADSLLAEVAPTYEDFIEPIRDVGLDYRIGFITGDDRFCTTSLFTTPPNVSHPGYCGLLATGPVGPRFEIPWRVIDGSETSPSPAVVFDGQIRKPQPFLPFTEAALEMAALSVQAQVVNEWNSEIHRPDAHLHFIFINDQDDASTGDLEFYTDALRYARGYPRRFDTTASAIVGPTPDGCTSPVFGDAAPAPNLAEAVRRIGGGPDQSVCNANWPALMETAGLAASGIRTRVQLARRAAPSSIRAFADGMEVPPFDGPEVNWFYESSTRTLTLRDPLFLAAGVEVEIEYQPACGNQ